MHIDRCLSLSSVILTPSYKIVGVTCCLIPPISCAFLTAYLLARWVIFAPWANSAAILNGAIWDRLANVAPYSGHGPI